MRALKLPTFNTKPRIRKSQVYKFLAAWECSSETTIFTFIGATPKLAWQAWDNYMKGKPRDGTRFVASIKGENNA